jgi:mannose-6-phosphate isomerase-like protein (cupin superfamily)
MFVKHLDDAEPFVCAGIKFGMLLPRNTKGSVEVVWERLEPFEITTSDRHASFDQLFVILKGTGEVTVGGVTSAIRPVAVVFIPLGTPHSVASKSDEGLEYLFFNVWKDKIPQAEADWKTVYSLIHNRRTAERVTNE